MLRKLLVRLLIVLILLIDFQYAKEVWIPHSPHFINKPRWTNMTFEVPEHLQNQANV